MRIGAYNSPLELSGAGDCLALEKSGVRREEDELIEQCGWCRRREEAQLERGSGNAGEMEHPSGI